MSRFSFRAVIGILGLGLALNFGEAEGGLENRPLDTDDAYTIGKGTTSMSFGSTFLRHDNHDRQTDLVGDLALGLAEHVEVDLQAPYTFLKPHGARHESSFGDLVVRPEIQFLEEGKRRPALSTWLAVKTKTGDEDEGIGTGTTDFSFAVNLTKKFAGPIWFHTNLGFSFSHVPEGRERENTFFYKVAGEYSPVKRLRLVAEIVGQNESSDPAASEAPLEWLVGIIYDTRKGILFDTGFGTGFTNASPDFRVTTGVTLNF